jgi:hypothetical protein
MPPAKRMKTKRHDEQDDRESIFAAARCSGNHLFLKTSPFADISFRNLCKSI